MPERLELREHERVSTIKLFARSPTMAGGWADQVTTYGVPTGAEAEITEVGVLVRDKDGATLHPWNRIVEVQIRYVLRFVPVPESEPPPPPRDPGKRTT